MKFRFLSILLLSFAMLSCNGQTTKKTEATVFAEKIKTTPNAQILDVRTPEEFAQGHLENASNINWLGNDFTINTKKLDKSKPVFIYCKSGNRSAKAAAKLEELGFKNIYELEGGILKWNIAELPTKTKQ